MTEKNKIVSKHLLSEELFNCADCFKAAKPWTKLGEMQLFVVSWRGSYLYCSIHEQHGLSVYPGEDGLFSLLKTLRLIETQEQVGRTLVESAYTQDCAQCSFVNRTDLDDWDHRCVIGSGHTYRGKQAWPQFRRYRPLRYPWYINETDEAMLIEALMAAIYLVRLLENQTYWKLLSQLTGQPLHPIACLTENAIEWGHLPCLAAQGEEQTYQLSAVKIADHRDEHFTAPMLTNDLDIARLRKVKSTGETLQCAITCLRMAIKDDAGGAPYVPLAFVMVAVRDMPTSRDAYIGAMELAMDYESGVRRWMSKFCGYIEEHGKPRQVITNEYRTDHLLKRLCGQLGIRYTFKEAPLDELNDAINGFDEQREQPEAKD